MVRTFDRAFKSISFVSALLSLVLIFSIFFTLLYYSREAIGGIGFLDFIFGTVWAPSQGVYGAFRPLMGTLITTIIAIVIAVPFGIGIAIFIVEVCPNVLKRPITTAIELLAAIPSIIYGMWALFTFSSFSNKFIEPFLDFTLSWLPFVGHFFSVDCGGADVCVNTSGVNILTAGIILAIMVLPFITMVAVETFERVPRVIKESAYGLGATRWEVVRDVMIPYSSVSIMGSIIVALGRALGETMAVAFIIGNSYAALQTLYSPYSTITSVLANEFNESDGLHRSSLFFLATILFMANFIILALFKYYIHKRANRFS